MDLVLTVCAHTCKCTYHTCANIHASSIYSLFLYPSRPQQPAPRTGARPGHLLSEGCEVPVLCLLLRPTPEPGSMGHIGPCPSVGGLGSLLWSSHSLEHVHKMPSAWAACLHAGHCVTDPPGTAVSTVCLEYASMST